MKRILTLGIFLSICCSNKVNAQWVAVQDSLALVDLYDSTDGPNWYNKGNWKTAYPVSTWDGVGVSNNRVNSLNFVGNNMNGKIPASFKNLTKLVSLNLIDNGLNANLDEFLDSLRALIAFHVGEYRFTNAIPASVANLVNLQEFTLYGSYGLEQIPNSFVRMNNLTTLDIQGNSISGDMSSFIPPNVTLLNISFNKLNFDPIEKLIKHFKNLPVAFYYNDQSTIKTMANGDRLWVSAGGTASENTYKWYKVGQGLIDSVKADSTFYPSTTGSYYAEVSNSIANDLILTSDPVKAAGIRAAICSGTISTDFTSEILGTTYKWQKSIDSVNYTALSNGTDYSGINGPTLNLNNVPAEKVGTRYRCLVDGNTGTVITITFKNRWAGGITGNWEDDANWSCGTIPDAKTDVVIESGTVVINSDVTVRSIRVMPGASLKVNTGYALTVKAQ